MWVLIHTDRAVWDSALFLGLHNGTSKPVVFGPFDTQLKAMEKGLEFAEVFRTKYIEDEVAGDGAAQANGAADAMHDKDEWCDGGCKIESYGHLWVRVIADSEVVAQWEVHEVKAVS